MFKITVTISKIKKKKEKFDIFCFYRELEYLTTDWFYTQTGKKYKRCGSAKVVRELYKREKELCKNVMIIIRTKLLFLLS
jgi:hypothetical protein